MPFPFFKKIKTLSPSPMFLIFQNLVGALLIAYYFHNIFQGSPIVGPYSSPQTFERYYDANID